jgi:energy-coupling factor transporter ATP-binding protein EcfA2
VLLRQVDLGGFKAFQEASIGTAPITVLIGPNNGGKSTVLQAVALLAQTVSSNSQGRVKTDGPLVDLGEDAARLANDSLGQRGPWSIGLTWHGSLNPVDQVPEIGFQLQAVQNRPQGFTTSAWVRQSLPPGRLVQASVVWGTGEPQKLRVTAPDLRTTNERLPPIERTVDINAFEPWRWQIMSQIARHNQSAILSGDPDAVVAEILLAATPYFSAGIAEQLRTFRYVGADRQVVRSAYPLGQGSTNPQSAEEVISSLARSDDILFQVSERLRKTFEYGLDKTLPSRQSFPRPVVQSEQVGLVGIGEGNRRRLLVNMGAGFAQFAWVALQLELARIVPIPFENESPLPTPIVGVEEPELHLHPRLQPAMARLLAQFALENGQVICSTQSEHFLLAILELVLEKTLKPEHVAIYYLDAPHGIVDRLDVDNNGQLKGGLKGFFEENERQIERQIDLLRKSANLGS